MTKKFWKDWQNRISETKHIYLNHFIINGDKTHYNYILSSIHGEDKILHATFNGDTVDLIVECHGWGNGHHIVENEHLTLHRNEIKAIEFIKKNIVEYYHF